MRLLASICAVVALSAVGARAQGPVEATRPSIAVVSGQRVSLESAEGKAGQARMQALQRERAVDLQARQRTLNETRQKLAEATDAVARGELQREASVQQADFDRAAAQAQIEIQNLQRQISGEVQARVRAALDEILKGRNVAVVLQQETAVIWAAPGLDLTSEVIAWMDEHPVAAR